MWVLFISQEDAFVAFVVPKNSMMFAEVAERLSTMRARVITVLNMACVMF